MFFKKKGPAKPASKVIDPPTAPKKAVSGALTRRFQVQDERPTTLLDQIGSQAEVKKAPGHADSPTRIFSSEEVADASADSAMKDPPVGWLVVVQGPGKGRAAPIGYGMNAIGRSATQRVNLDFGDEKISRERQALVTYDGKSRKFYVQHGGGPTLTYLKDSPVLVPVEIQAGDHIALGDTVLRFLPLCSNDFDWLT